MMGAQIIYHAAFEFHEIETKKWPEFVYINDGSFMQVDTIWPRKERGCWVVTLKKF
jgi:hypothetical protein